MNEHVRDDYLSFGVFCFVFVLCFVYLSLIFFINFLNCYFEEWAPLTRTILLGPKILLSDLQQENVNYLSNIHSNVSNEKIHVFIQIRHRLNCTVQVQMVPHLTFVFLRHLFLAKWETQFRLRM